MATPAPEPETVHICTVMPTFQEAKHIERALRSVMTQTWPAERHLVHVLDGGSTDGTRAHVERLAAESAANGGPRILLLDNPGRFVPHARNRSLERLPPETTHLLEMSGHAWIPEDHLERRVADLLDLEAELGRPVGAIGTRVRGNPDQSSRRARWIEAALASPLGSSGGQFARFSGRQPSDVPPFSLYRREAVEAVGGWDPYFTTSQDSVLNRLLAKAGWPVWRSDVSWIWMHKRDTLRQWWRMGHRYGFWRTKVLLRDPGRASLLEFAPWAGALTTLGLGLAGIAWWWWLPAAYGAALVADGVRAAVTRRDATLLLGDPLTVAMLHTSFSLGLLVGAVRPPRGASDRAAPVVAGGVAPADAPGADEAE